MFQLINKDKSVGAFNVGGSRNGQWTTGWVWAADYLLIFTDNATGKTVTVGANLTPGVPVNVDVNRACFGFPAC